MVGWKNTQQNSATEEYLLIQLKSFKVSNKHETRCHPFIDGPKPGQQQDRMAQAIFEKPINISM